MEVGDVRAADLHSANLYPPTEHHPRGMSRTFHAMYGHDRPSSPEGMRALTDEERAINVVWTWDADLGTYTSEAYPEGIA
jgi:hypothetical protein